MLAWGCPYLNVKIRIHPKEYIFKIIKIFSFLLGKKMLDTRRWIIVVETGLRVFKNYVRLEKALKKYFRRKSTYRFLSINDQ